MQLRSFSYLNNVAGILKVGKPSDRQQRRSFKRGIEMSKWRLLSSRGLNV